MDVKEISPVPSRLHYRLTYGDGWYRDKNGERVGFALRPYLDGIDLDRQCTAVLLRTAVLLATMCGVGLRQVCWLMGMLFNVDVTKSTLDRWVKSCAAQLPDQGEMARILHASKPISVGHFDEIFPKGQRPKPCTLVLRDEHGRIFAVQPVEERTEASVIAFLTKVKSWGIEFKAFYVDGCEAYRGAIRKVYPNAVIQYDNFHVIQSAFRKLWKTVVARRRELKQRAVDSTTAAYSDRLAGLAKRVWEGRYLFFTRDRNLTETQKTEMHALLEADHVLDHVRGFVLGLWAVFEVGQTLEQAQTKLQALWNLPGGGSGSTFEKVLTSIENRFGDATAFLSHAGVTRNSLAETGIRVLRRLERGHDGFRGNDGLDCYVRIYQAIKYCGWAVHQSAPGLGLVPIPPPVEHLA